MRLGADDQQPDPHQSQGHREQADDDHAYAEQAGEETNAHTEDGRQSQVEPVLIAGGVQPGKDPADGKARVEPERAVAAGTSQKKSRHQEQGSSHDQVEEPARDVTEDDGAEYRSRYGGGGQHQP